MLKHQTFRHASGRLAANIEVNVWDSSGINLLTTVTTDALGLAVVNLPVGNYQWEYLGYRVPFEIVSGGEGGESGPNYVHNQPTPAGQWTIVHNLNDYVEPLVFLADDPTTPVETDMEFPDANTTILIFPEPVAGRAEF